MKKLQIFVAVLSIGTLLLPTIAPAHTLKVRKPACIKMYAEWKTHKNHKAFAVTTISKIQHCGYSSGKSSVKAAENSAMKYCRKYGTCGIVKSL